MTSERQPEPVLRRATETEPALTDARRLNEEFVLADVCFG